MKRVVAVAVLAMWAVVGLAFPNAGNDDTRKLDCSKWPIPDSLWALVTEAQVAKATTNLEFRATLFRGWEEAAVVDKCLARGLGILLAQIQNTQGLTLPSEAKVLAYVRTLSTVKLIQSESLGFVMCLTPELRAEFPAAIQTMAERAGVTTATPVNRAFYCKYLTKTGDMAAASIQDVLTVLLSGEEAVISTDELTKIIQTRIEKLAKVALRKAGKSFVAKVVVHDGKEVLNNPVAIAAKPALDALNAPACDGLEKAMTDLGEPVAPIDRTAFLSALTGWKTLVDNGESINPAVIAKIRIGLGLAGYNKWVDTYNNGVTP